MSLWQRGVAWGKANPDKVVPISLVVIVALLLAAIFLSRVDFANTPPYGKLQDPESPALLVKGKNGKQYAISRRALRSMQEISAKSTATNVDPSLLEWMSKSDRNLFESSLTDFCRQRKAYITEQSSATGPPGDVPRILLASCAGIETSGKVIPGQLLRKLMALAEFERANGKAPDRLMVQTVYESLVRSMKRSVGAKSEAELFERSGLKKQDLMQMAEAEAAYGELSRAPERPSWDEARAFYEKNRSFYARPAMILAYERRSYSLDKAEKIYRSLQSAPVEKEIGLATPWLTAKNLRPEQRFLLTSEPGTVSPPVKLKFRDDDGEPAVLVTGEKEFYQMLRVREVRPYKPPPSFEAIKEKVRSDLEARLVGRADQDLSDRLDRNWGERTFCDKGSSDQAQLARCAREDK